MQLLDWLVRSQLKVLAIEQQHATLSRCSAVHTDADPERLDASPATILDSHMQSAQHPRNPSAKPTFGSQIVAFPGSALRPQARPARRAAAPTGPIGRASRLKCGSTCMRRRPGVGATIFGACLFSSAVLPPFDPSLRSSAPDRTSRPALCGGCAVPAPFPRPSSPSRRPGD